MKWIYLLSSMDCNDKWNKSSNKVNFFLIASRQLVKWCLFSSFRDDFSGVYVTLFSVCTLGDPLNEGHECFLFLKFRIEGIQIWSGYNWHFLSICELYKIWEFNLWKLRNLNLLKITCPCIFLLELLEIFFYMVS